MANVDFVYLTEMLFMNNFGVNVMVSLIEPDIGKFLASFSTVDKVIACLDQDTGPTNILSEHFHSLTQACKPVLLM